MSALNSRYNRIICTASASRQSTFALKCSVMDKKSCMSTKMNGQNPSMQQDRRTQRTQQTLLDALMALLQVRHYDAITVKDIIEKANVGRSTFYAHYQTKEDLLKSGFERVLEMLVEAGNFRCGQSAFDPGYHSLISPCPKPCSTLSHPRLGVGFRGDYHPGSGFAWREIPSTSLCFFVRGTAAQCSAFCLVLFIGRQCVDLAQMVVGERHAGDPRNNG